MREERLGLVTVRHQVPGFRTVVIRSFQAKQTEHGVLPNRNGEVGHGWGGGLKEGKFCLSC